jgi:hypothetical protein
LKQAPRAWYERLKAFLLAKGFKMGSVDKNFVSPQARHRHSVGLDLRGWYHFQWLLSRSCCNVFWDYEQGEVVDQKEYRSMIGSLLYPMVMRPDIQFEVCLCACFQSSPRTSHRQVVKRIMRNLCFTPKFGLWFSASSSLSLCGYSNADYAGCRVQRKSTSGTCQFLGSSLVSWSSRK